MCRTHRDHPGDHGTSTPVRVPAPTPTRQPIRQAEAKIERDDARPRLCRDLRPRRRAAPGAAAQPRGQL
ncbi:hypothetical protein FAGKG844_110113 [Frankia sp. AgKG'84/4]